MAKRKEEKREKKEKKSKKVGFRLKLIAIIIPVVLAIIVVFFLLARNMVLKISKEKLQAQAQVNAEEINAWADQIFSELQLYQDAIESGIFAKDADILKFMEISAERNDAYLGGIYMGDDSGVYLDGSGWVPGDDWVLEERDWYVDGKDNEEFAFGEPYYDSMTGEVCVSPAVRVNYDKAVRVLAADVYLNRVAEIVNETASEGALGVFLVTGESQTIIAHPDVSMMALTLGAEGQDALYANMKSALAGNHDGVLSMKGDSGKYYVCMNSIDHTDWYLVTYITERQMLSDLHWMEMYMMLMALAAAVVLIFAVLRVTGRIVKPVAKVTGVIGELAGGDFSRDLEISGNDEIAAMGKNMQRFIVNMRSTITEISDTANWLNRQSTDNESVSASLMSSAQNQTESVERLTQLATELSRQADNAAEQMEALAELVRRTHEDGNTAKKLMEQSVEMSQSGRDNMEHINNGMESVNHSISALSEQIEKVGNAMERIGNMVDMIMDISEETNLLALNASIEAARAGEAGRGFAVVAEQIGKLAANSNEAADDIAKLTSEIRATVSEAVEHTKESVSEVEKSSDIVAQAKETFGELYEKVEETSRCVEEMIALVGKVDKVSVQMKQITEGQRTAAGEIVQSAGEMSASAQNTDENSRIVAQSAENLKEESVKLMEKMNGFIIKR